MIEVSIFIPLLLSLVEPAADAVCAVSCLNCTSIKYRVSDTLLARNLMDEVRLHSSNTHTTHRNLRSWWWKFFQICSCCRLLYRWYLLFMFNAFAGCSTLNPSLCIKLLMQVPQLISGRCTRRVSSWADCALSLSPPPSDWCVHVFQIENRFLLEINLLIHSKNIEWLSCVKQFGRVLKREQGESRASRRDHHSAIIVNQSRVERRVGFYVFARIHHSALIYHASTIIWTLQKNINFASN